MRIALFSDTYWPQVNGVAMTLKRLTEHLERRNVTYQIFVPRCEDELYTSNVHGFASFPFLLYPECRIALPNYVSITRQLQAFQPDLIHIATPFNIGLSGLFYARKYDIAHVASYHTHFDRYLHYYHLQFASPLLWRYIRWFHQSCLATFVPSQETAQQLAAQGIDGIKLWQRGVDCKLFHPGKKSAAVRERYGIKERFILLYAGRLAPEKDLDIIPDIMRKLPESLRDEIHWIFAGDGPSLKELQDGVPANTTFTGYMKGEALAELYASADLFVFPSSTETFGNVVLESLASGTPAIGAASGGVQEIIQHGRTGNLCPPRDSDMFAQSITNMLQQPDTLKAWGLSGRAYALTQSWEAIFDRLLVNYEQILRSKASRGKPFSA
ncbi:glycosyltransferase family 4 protein [Paenibacillus thalictri]|uniref:Glycosyltransferase family 1 protein n=1 Tax=Paenibacillus thalictri TaxID=2527873 RepID=A0A4Q9DQZ8_9BACL|nr:glycosyltransferase family 1 protein [Paenibacillus thalictri]TBL79057.1 glycosyltransferase family 1 protein [Paenibacillus thalictri]